jgi:hypothetical protein
VGKSAASQQRLQLLLEPGITHIGIIIFFIPVSSVTQIADFCFRRREHPFRVTLGQVTAIPKILIHLAVTPRQRFY